MGSWDPNGNLHFHGRKDHQFKHLGYRLEANGIEEIALSSGMIHEACIQYDAGKQQIVLFYIPSESWEPREFRRFLMGAMPAYMLPTRMIELDRMPRTISGKSMGFARRNNIWKERRGESDTARKTGIDCRTSVGAS